MLFNILSVILIWFIASIITSIYVISDASSGNIDENLTPYTQVSMSIGAVITLVFMWVMTWQNWWR